MLDLLPGGCDEPLDILCLGAHADDIEIGCGGTVLALLLGGQRVRCRWVVFSAPGERAAEAERSASAFLDGSTASDVAIGQHRESYFPFEGSAIKDEIHSLANSMSPDIVFTHHRADRHQDHRLISELTWNAFRDHLILEYEIPKYDGELGSPNVFVPLTRAVCDKKIGLLETMFPSQASRYWFDRETFLSLLRLRGVESRSSTRYAEGFHARKLVVDLSRRGEEDRRR